MLRWILLSTLLMFAQSQGGPTFEAASIKFVAADLPERAAFRTDPSRIDVRKTGLAALIQRAYSVPWYRILWNRAVDSDGRKFGRMPQYDIQATLPPDSTDAQIRVMLQRLLEDRLKLQTHREPMDLPVYLLTISKSGLRMKKSDGPPEDATGKSAETSTQELRYRRTVTISTLLDFLRLEVDRPIVDLTGLGGVYEIDLRWAHQFSDLENQGSHDPANMSSLFAAMEKELGLKVEAGKTTLDMLVIDRVNSMPTEN